MVNLTSENYRAAVEEAELPVLIDFFAQWCGPCKAFAPIFAELDEEFGQRCVFCKVDIDAQEGLAQQFDILSVPTLIYLQEGEILQRISGLHSREDIIEMLNFN